MALIPKTSFAINFSGDVAPILNSLTEIAKTQLPIARAAALTRTASEARTTLRTLMPQFVDRPRDFTVRGILHHRATKAEPVSWVYIKGDSRGTYLPFVITKGVQHTKRGKQMLKPVDFDTVKLDKHGNIKSYRSGAQVRGLLRKRGYFRGKVKTSRGMVGGIWYRGKRFKKDRGKPREPLELILKYDSDAEHKPIFPYEEIIIRVGRTRLPHHLSKAIIEFVKTRKPKTK